MRIILLLLSLIVVFISCEEMPVEKNFEYGSVTDVQGNEYVTIKIGDQWWMAENLRSTAFSNGVSIQKISADSDWATANEASYTEYDNTSQITGLLYNAACLGSENDIAPDGWHIATDEEWKELEEFAGMSVDDLDKINWRGEIGDRLKKSDLEGWTRYEDLWPTDDFGFSARGGSGRYFGGAFAVPGIRQSGFWWTSTKAENGEYWYRYMDYKKEGVFRYTGHANYGFSIRCVKNN